MNIQNIDKDKIAAWAVHGFTASGAVLGFLAIISIFNNDQTSSFLWLGLALLVDGLDGTIARKVGVSDKAPNIDGSTLDNVIDYLNYVIIPSLMIYWFQMVPNGWEIIIPASIFAVSLYTFANINMKTEDYYFSGFPALWNIVVLYFYILNTNHYINLIVIIFLSILTFIPIKFVHPLRVKKLRNITIFCTIIWSATTLKLVTTFPEINLFNEKIVLTIWIICSFYFAAICGSRSFKDLK
ncbi:MAG: CDP-alcohol phosphatidyltransferase family protein [Pelagibacteraceae bacterium]|jgi:phosphatidylcholine synthase|nr:CDP-alcohol phosphatidyltransferase family protein [Pelagibacteraceae bacterium]MBO6470500.1 CDP-alcohol phosphatidyltransferase family protein [Pelagibacteraceae bacterium]MBO6471653.1 CDP-alcohol phosphatidyltransferase family protein [Pelagibacteraceae bacterium]MBO6472309.1 CDP-alcohol phosphatidyltransferase family protein [Pelagibacteraceae bacterium]HJO13497.1 CDP-alcohol phosphatidyltransferase family protein [Alphaproteobacteria bacterium]